MNKTLLTDVLVNSEGRVIGAIGVDISEDEPEMVIFQAKAVLIAAGSATRLYPGITPAYMFNDSGCPANTGDGHAMAYRAGARLANLEMQEATRGQDILPEAAKAHGFGLTSDINGQCITLIRTSLPEKTAISRRIYGRDLTVTACRPVQALHI